MNYFPFTEQSSGLKSIRGIVLLFICSLKQLIYISIYSPKYKLILFITQTLGYLSRNAELSGLDLARLINEN